MYNTFAVSEYEKKSEGKTELKNNNLVDDLTYLTYAVHAGGGPRDGF